MGTYCKLSLIDKSDTFIKNVNKELHDKGIDRIIYYNDIPYGAFTTHEMLEEDARYMNEDPEGLKQSPDSKRPITVKWLSQFFWNEIGTYHLKISAAYAHELKKIIAIRNYCRDNNYLDQKLSENHHELDYRLKIALENENSRNIH